MYWVPICRRFRILCIECGSVPGFYVLCSGLFLGPHFINCVLVWILLTESGLRIYVPDPDPNADSDFINTLHPQAHGAWISFPPPPFKRMPHAPVFAPR